MQVRAQQCTSPEIYSRTIIITNPLHRALTADRLLSRPKRDHATCVIFFDRQEKVDAIELMAALTKQLAEQGRYIPDIIMRMFTSYATSSKNKLASDDVHKMLITEIGRFRRINIVIDALDECSPPQTRLDLFNCLVQLQKTYPYLKIIMSTRIIGPVIEEIKRKFIKITEFHVRAHAGDLHKYISGQFEDKVELREARRHTGLVEQLTHDLISEADGM